MYNNENNNNYENSSTSSDDSNDSSIINIDENKVIDNFYDWLVDKSLNIDEENKNYRLMLRDPLNDSIYLTPNTIDIYKNIIFFGNRYSVLIKVNEILLNLNDEYTNTYKWIDNVVEHYLYDNDNIDINEINYDNINNEDIFNLFFDQNDDNEIYLSEINLKIINV